MRPVRAGLRDLRRGEGGGPRRDDADALIRRLVAEHPRRLRFLLREQHGGTTEIRRAIDAELRLLTGELAIDLARTAALARWSAVDIDTAAGLYLSAAIDGAADLLAAGDTDSEAYRTAADRLDLRLRIITAGTAALGPPD